MATDVVKQTYIAQQKCVYEAGDKARILPAMVGGRERERNYIQVFVAPDCEPTRGSEIVVAPLADHMQLFIQRNNTCSRLT